MPVTEVVGPHRVANDYLDQFDLPDGSEATAPPELRGRGRHEVRLEVADADRGIVHTSFASLPSFLAPGDLLVVNDSATMPAALDGVLDGDRVRVHVSTGLPDGEHRLIELREPHDWWSTPSGAGRAGQTLTLPAGVTVVLVERHRGGRLWKARFPEGLDVPRYLGACGDPIQYGYTECRLPIDAYQTIFATRPGSSEMPSAGRAFSHEMLRRLDDLGVDVVPITLHTGVASLEAGEPPYEEHATVSAEAARAVNDATRSGRRVIAVGTTAIRALESAHDGTEVRPFAGFTSLVVSPDHVVRSVDGLLTGWHEPRATHLHILEALAGHELLSSAYREAVRQRYLWHEFGDLNLIIRPRLSHDPEVFR